MKKKFTINRRNFLKILSFLLLFPNIALSKAQVYLNKKIVIKNENIESKCGWSPFNGVEFKGAPVATIVDGKLKMKNGEILGNPEGMPLKFQN